MEKSDAADVVVVPGKGGGISWSHPEYFAHKVGRSRSLRRQLVSLVFPSQTQRTRPTTTGWVLMLLSMGIGLAAYNTSSNILFMTLSLLLSSLVLSGILSVLNFRGTSWQLHLPPHLRAGEPARMQIEVKNAKRLLPTYSIWFNVKAGDDAATDRIFLESRLDPGKKEHLDWIYTPKRRGAMVLEVSGMESKYPFGFLRKTLGGGTRQTVRVWPARIDYAWTPSPGRERHLHGATLKRIGTGSDLIGLRPYRRGDPPRNVHWKASARLRKLMVRLLSDEAESGFVLFLETSTRLWTEEDRFDRMCDLAGTLAEDLFRADRLLGIAVDHEPLITVKTFPDLHNFLDRLAVLEPSRDGREVQRPSGPHLICFRPDSAGEIQIVLSGHEAGATQS